MWSNFTDFAIKAQKDLQDQANEAAMKLSTAAPPVDVSTTMSSFFNLDSMQSSSSPSLQPPNVVSASTTTTTTEMDHNLDSQTNPNHNDDNHNFSITPPILPVVGVSVSSSSSITEPTTITVMNNNDDNNSNDYNNDNNRVNHEGAVATTIPSSSSSSEVMKQHDGTDQCATTTNDTTTTAAAVEVVDNNSNNSNTNIHSMIHDDTNNNNNNNNIGTNGTRTTTTTTTTTSMIQEEDCKETTTTTNNNNDDDKNDDDDDPVTTTTTTMESKFRLVVEADEDTSHSTTTIGDDKEIGIVSSSSIPQPQQPHNEKIVVVEEEQVQVDIVVVDPVISTHQQQQQPLDHMIDPPDDIISTTTTEPSDTPTGPHQSQQQQLHNNTTERNNDNQQQQQQKSPWIDHTVNMIEIPKVEEEIVVTKERLDDPDTDTSHNNNNMQVLSPMTPSPKDTNIHNNNINERYGGGNGMNKLLLLISTNSIDRQVKVRQDLVQTALTASNIQYDIIDGSLHGSSSGGAGAGGGNNNNHNNDDDTNITLRNELFTLSGLRGVYPQFFIVNLDGTNSSSNSGTGTTFWGTFEEFQHVNDDGQLQQVFGRYIKDDSTMQSPDIDNSSITRNLYPSATVPDDVYEKFSQQIQRIEENYQLERQETDRQHLQEIEQQQMLHQQCEAAKRELEDTLTNEIRQKDEQLQEIYRRNEGYRLKLDVLKREVTGTQELVQGRDHDIQKANQKFLNDLRAMEKQMNAAEKSATKYQEEVQTIQGMLRTTESELSSSKQEYETIKERAKSMATELKDRRSECRQLQDTIVELTQENGSLKSMVDALEERLNHQGLNQSDKDKEIETLRVKLIETNQELTTIEKVWQEKITKSEHILTEYKKRAQHSLSMSNSRTAAAVQAREEAELDARAARCTADAALERSVKAEVESRETMAEAKITVKMMEDERNVAIRNLDQLKDQVLASELARTTKERELDTIMVSQKNKDMEISLLQGNINQADAKVASTQQKIMELTNTIDDLQQEIFTVREELQRVTTAAGNDTSTKKDDESSRGIKFSPSPMLLNGSQDDAEGDDTIAALRMELREANDAIEDLKSALKNAIQINEEQHHNVTVSNAGSTIPDDSVRSEYTGSTDTGTIPLFYAMEKQAELKTARTEMNRLASALADVQSEKMEAYDAMDEMRRKLDDAESRLKRNEKLGMNANSTLPDNENENHNASAVNIEYLKHILLRFMNAKTPTERKTLVPVIGAVLELTPDEVSAATQNIERTSTGIVGTNSSSLFGFLS